MGVSLPVQPGLCVGRDVVCKRGMCWRCRAACCCVPPDYVAHGFVASRIAQPVSAAFGCLPAGVNAVAILRRALTGTVLSYRHAGSGKAYCATLTCSITLFTLIPYTIAAPP